MSGATGPYLYMGGVDRARRGPGLGRIAVVAIAVLGILAWSVSNSPRIAAQSWEQYSGSDCATEVWDCYVVWSWDVTRFASVDAFFTLTVHNGTRGYYRWECTDSIRGAGSFYGTADYSVNLSPTNAPLLHLTVSAGTTMCAFHVWSASGATRGFQVTNSRFVAQVGDVVPTDQPGWSALPTPTANPDWTYCPSASSYPGFSPEPSICAGYTWTTDDEFCYGHWLCWVGNIAGLPSTSFDRAVPIIGQSAPWTRAAFTSGQQFNYRFELSYSNDGTTYYNNNNYLVMDKTEAGTSPYACSGSNAWQVTSSGTGNTWSGGAVTRTGMTTVVSGWSAVAGGACLHFADSHGLTSARVRFYLDPVSGSPTPVPGGGGTATSPPNSPPPTPTPPPGSGGHAGATTAPVNICPNPRPSPEIWACRTDNTGGTPGSPWPSGPAIPQDTYLSAKWAALASGLGEKAPFGYINQVTDVLSGAAGDAAGSAPDWCMDFPLWAPAAGGGSHTSSICFPMDDVASWLSGFRGVLLALLMLAAALTVARLVLAAVQVNTGDGKE